MRATVRTLGTPWLLECGAPSGRSTVSGRGTARREARPEDVHRSGIFQRRNVYKIRLCFSSDIKPKKRNARNESEWIGKHQPKQARRSRLRATRTEHRCRDDVRRGDAPPAGSASFLCISDCVERLTVTNILLRGTPVKLMACNSHDRHPPPLRKCALRVTKPGREQLLLPFPSKRPKPHEKREARFRWQVCVTPVPRASSPAPTKWGRRSFPEGLGGEVTPLPPPPGF